MHGAPSLSATMMENFISRELRKKRLVKGSLGDVDGFPERNARRLVHRARDGIQDPLSLILFIRFSHTCSQLLKSEGTHVGCICLALKLCSCESLSTRPPSRGRLAVGERVRRGAEQGNEPRKPTRSYCQSQTQLDFRGAGRTEDRAISPRGSARRVPAPAAHAC
jgi:hypothetical protein